MNLRFALAFIFMISSFSELPTAGAAATVCSTQFVPSLWQTIESINRNNQGFLTETIPLSEFGANLSWTKKRQLRKILNDRSLAKLTLAGSVERKATELAILLFGRKNVVDQFVFKNSDQRLQDSTLYKTKETLLREGLIDYWNKNHEIGNSTALRRAFERFTLIRHNQMFELLGFPFRLPHLNDQNLPPRLILNIVRDGFEAHAKEAAHYLNWQNKIDAYNSFRRLYSPLVFGIILTFTSFVAFQNIEQIHQTQVDEVLTQIRSTQKNLDVLVSDAKQAEFDQALREAIANFETKWGESPTPSERQIIQDRIANALTPQNSP